MKKLFLLGAVLLAIPAPAESKPPVRYELIEVVDGDFWVRDHDLSGEDCVRQMKRFRAERRGWLLFCRVQRGARMVA